MFGTLYARTHTHTHHTSYTPRTRKLNKCRAICQCALCYYSSLLLPDDKPQLPRSRVWSGTFLVGCVCVCVVGFSHLAARVKILHCFFRSFCIHSFLSHSQLLRNARARDFSCGICQPKRKEGAHPHTPVLCIWHQVFVILFE